ncbi:thiamine phosphate synthase [Luteimonas qiangzhengi]|uniref:thiamine phosphate synthase n=1 Tax=Luteimonas sp. MJ146 TaxID=3129240 RepID=UPI0031BBBDA1
MNNKSAAARGLYLITPDECDTPRLLDRVREVIGQATWLQYRNKAADAGLRHTQAAALRTLCTEAGVPLIINDDPELARACDADGVHLGEDDGGIAAARALLGESAIIGISCYDDLERAQQMATAGADYVAFGAFFPSSSKTTSRRASPALLREAGALGLPRVAIGGINADNAPALVAAGADLIAVIGAVFDAPDPRASAQSLRRAFDA